MLAKKIGWIGTGVMGKSMAGHLIKAGYELSVFNRTASKADDLVAQGARFTSPQELSKSSDIIFLMLGYPHDVRKTVLDSKTGILSHLSPGSILVDHTTSEPALAAEIAERCQERGILSVDAPVSGGDIGARNGQVVAMCGGSEEAFTSIKPVLEVYSKVAKLHGEAGAGQHTKMVNQINIAGSMIGVCEGLLYGYKAGLNMEEVLETIGGGAAGSFSLAAYGPRILKGDMEPGFYVEHFVKDMEIALDECRRMNISLPGLALVHQLYRGLMAQGEGRKGTQALFTTLERINGSKL